MRLTEEQYNSLVHRQIVPVPKKNKYNAVITEVNQIRFQSKREAAYYRMLQARVHGGEVKYFLTQVPFRLIGGVVYRVDFMEVWEDGSIHFVDVKGHRTQAYINKRKQVEAMYPVRIEEA